MDRVIFLSIFNLVLHNYVMTVKQYYVLGEDVGRSNQTGENKRVYCKVQNLLPHIKVVFKQWINNLGFFFF